jgi:hypothetical protein
MLKTELVWEGQYDEYGNRREVDVAGCAMPLQKIETIDEPRSRAEAQGKLFDPKKSHPDDFRNMLISVQVYRAPRKRGHGRKGHRSFAVEKLDRGPRHVAESSEVT